MLVKVTAWNQYRSEPCAATALQGDANISLVQEHWKNPKTKDIHGRCSGPYTKIWNLARRSAAYISRKIDPGLWDCESGDDWTRITLLPEGAEPVHIFSIYCESYKEN